MNAIVALLGLLVPHAAPAAPETPPPNLVLIISDDHAWTDFGFMGHPRIRTPRLDRLAAESLVFRNGHVPSSLCSPSLASIITGLFPHQHRVTSNDPPAPAGKTGAAARKDEGYLAARRELIANFDRVPTLPRLLAAHGYASFQTGKWWGGNFKHGGFTEGMSHGDPDQGGRHGDAGLAIGRETMQPIFDFIDRSTSQKTPFLVWYAPMMPHSPHKPPERLLAKYRDQAPTLEIAKYWAMCEWLDETTGQLLDYLDSRKLAENTLVVFLADNGWIQDPDADRYAPRSKQSPYEGGLRTPILLRRPGKITPAVNDQYVSSIDIVPTMLTAAGIKPPAELPGINLLDAKAVADRKAIFGDCFTHNAVDLERPASSIRFRWVITTDQPGKALKLVLPYPANEPDAKPELFDLINDPHEKADLAAKQPESVARLTAMIDAWWPISK